MVHIGVIRNFGGETEWLVSLLLRNFSVHQDWISISINHEISVLSGKLNFKLYFT